MAEEGKIIFEKGYGFANLEWEIHNAPDTKFRLGSITKQFTSMLIMQQVEKGNIRLDATVATYIPDYPKPQGEKVTRTPYERLLQSDILLPLGMKNTGYDHGEEILPKRAAGYERIGHLVNAPFIDMSVPFSAGALYNERSLELNGSNAGAVEALKKLKEAP